MQVRAGIEGLLGIPVLKQLVEGLRRYATARRRESPNVSDETIEKLESARKELTSEYEKKVERLAEIEPRQAELTEEQDLLQRELSSFGAGSQALMQEQYEQIKGYERAIDDKKTQLEDVMMKDLALALSGLPFRQSVKVRLSERGCARALGERQEPG